MNGAKFSMRERVIDHAGWETLVMRIGFAWLMWSMLPATLPFISQPVPNGLGYLADLTFLGSADVYATLRIGFGVAAILFSLGVAPLVTLGYPAALLIMVGALENSQGAIGHHLQLTCLVAGAMWIGYWNRGSRGLISHGLFPDVITHNRSVHFAKLMIAVSYVTSACVKIIASGGAWIAQLPDISLQLIKTHANVYYDTLWPQTGWMATELPYWLAEHPWITRLFFSPGLFLELFAFVALLGRRPAAIIGVGLLIMHYLIGFVMGLRFSAHEWLLLIFLVNIPYWIWREWLKFSDQKSEVPSDSGIS